MAGGGSGCAAVAPPSCSSAMMRRIEERISSIEGSWSLLVVVILSVPSLAKALLGLGCARSLPSCARA